MVLDKIYDTWDNVDETFKNTARKYPGMTKYDFLVTLLGKDDSLVKLRSLIDKDFVATEESIKMLNTLFTVLEAAKRKLASVTVVDDLDSFVWGTPGQEEVFMLDVEEYNPGHLTCYTDAKDLWKHGYFTSAFVLEKDGSVKNYLLDMAAQELKFFETEREAVLWANSLKDKIQKDNSFFEKVYLYLLSASADQQLRFPCVFVSFDPGTTPAGKVSYKAKLPDSNGNKIIVSVNAERSFKETLVCNVEVIYAR